MTGIYRPSNPGASFDYQTGKLTEFKSDSVTVMHPWPAPLAWRKSKTTPTWHACRPALSLPEGNIERQIRKICEPADSIGQLEGRTVRSPYEEKLANDRLAVLRWCNLIPKDVRRLITRYSNRHWHMLSFLARCGEPALDLVRSNPALAYLLASNWVFHKPAVTQPLRSARALLKCGKSQRDILWWLDFPDTKATRKVLRKIRPSSLGMLPMLYLRDSLGDVNVDKALAHLPVINANILRIVTDPHLFQHVKPAFLAELSELKKGIDKAKYAYKLQDCIAMFNMTNPELLFPAMCSISQIEKLHDLLVEDMAVMKTNGEYRDFPEPPIAGNENIVPLRSADELISEGKEQKSCVGGYIERVLSRKCYIYKILTPQRCTMSITPIYDSWKVSELKSHANGVPSLDVQLTVNKWLSKALRGKDRQSHDAESGLHQPRQFVIEFE